MILSVTFEKTTYNELPYKFEAGTPHIAGAHRPGRGDRLSERAGHGEHRRLRARSDGSTDAQALSQVPGLRMIGTAKEKASVFSFVLGDVHPHDAAQSGRAGRRGAHGQHCAQPVMQRFGIPATVRASLGCYNTREEIDALVPGCARLRR